MSHTLRGSMLVALAAALASCSLFDYSGIVTHRYALVYGVTCYTTEVAPGTGPNLAYPDADASAMASLLTAQGYTVHSRWVDYDGFVWIDGADTGNQVGAPATSTPDGSTMGGTPGAGDPDAPSKANILADLQNLVSTIGHDDLLVVYFSGHGTQDTSASPSREYFDPWGSVARYVPDGNYYDFPVPSVRDDELGLAFDAIDTPRKVLILDTCNSGGFIGNELETDWTPPAITNGPVWVSPGTLIAAMSAYFSLQSSATGLSPYHAQVLSAAGRDELSYETSSYGHGVMTYWLLRGLAGPADLNHDGKITELEAFAYAKAGVDQNWNPAVGSAGAFEPHVSGGPVDFVLF